ncbi:MAG: glycoside hydrolase family 95 protein [Clostridia bacterium]|nr:glycoside hydrolase family 95 protein [Clostridia bacterium]
MDRKLWYEQAANCFEEALPIGNGHMGGMVYSNTGEEHISLNEDTLWSGAPKSCLPTDYEGAADEVRRLMAQGDRDGAAHVVWQRLMGDFTACYAPAGDGYISLDEAGEVQAYRRELDLATGVVTACYRIGDTQYTREVFCSYPDDVFVVRLKANQPVLSGRIRLESPHPFAVKAADKTLYAHSKMPYEINLAGHVGTKGAYYDEEKPSVRFCMAAQVHTTDGTVKAESDALRFESASELVVTLHIATDFTDYAHTPCGTPETLQKACDDVLQRAGDKSFDELKTTHICDHGDLFGKMDLHLGGPRRDTLPTDERLRANDEARDDVGLQELLFQYGRYLLIACSRPGSQPANLQGIWNELVLAPWCSGYTLNINLPMNYWHAESTGLSECHQPLLDFVRELAQRGKESAKVYGCRGWLAHHNTDLWRYSGLVGRDWRTCMPGVAYACWFMGGAWLTNHLWEHYLHTGDTAFLRENFEILRGNVQFLLDFLVENEDGFLVPGFGTTPENSYWYKEQKQAICQGATEDMAIIRNSFAMFRRTCEVLQIADDLIPAVVDAERRLLPYQIGGHGQLLEWEKDFETCDIRHVNMAPLWGCYPGNTITPRKTPELAEAARVLMEDRGDNGTGHSLCWKLCLRARLGDTERAYAFVQRMLQLVLPGEMNRGGGVYPNLLDVHPPFQIDGNFGVTAGMVEMLVQSHEDVIRLLPSLPHAWQDGQVRGLVVRGGLTVDIAWREHRLQNATLTATHDGTYRVQVEPHWTVRVNGKTVPIDNENIASFTVCAGDACEIAVG